MRANRSVVATPGRDESGEARPLLPVVIALLLFGCMALRILGGFDTGRAFEERVRARVRASPTLVEEELVRQVGADAGALGVQLEQGGIWTERQGSGGGISLVHLSYQVPVSLVIYVWRKQAADHEIKP